MKVYCDLDGVLCDFNARFEEFSGTTPEKFRAKNNSKAFWDELGKHGVKWWSHMNWTKDGKELWDYLVANYNEDLEILTGSPWGTVGYHAHKGKNIWGARELGLYTINHKSGSKKWELCKNDDDILIDDTQKVIDKWINNGNGVGILHTDAKSTIEKLKNL
jgi:hypothetical protein